jgi:dipeptidase D
MVFSPWELRIMTSFAFFIPTNKENIMNPTDLILKNFERISSIPRDTKNEAGIRAWLQDWASARSLTSKTDAIGNLVIQVPASGGYENHPILILQGHLDMVCQKTPDSPHDFKRDPICIIRDGDWIKADRTTLGADNGIAIALMMAIVEDETIVHPPLEFLLTVEEELGVVGADNLDPSLLAGKTLINLDSEDEGIFTIGCAGGGSTYLTLPVNWEFQLPDEVAFELKVGGLRGGHSGDDIHKHRANANKLMARALDLLQRNASIHLSALKGGTARNAIPRDAEAAFVCDRGMSARCRVVIDQLAGTLREEYKQAEPNLFLKLTEMKDSVAGVISVADTRKIIQVLMILPNGVAEMSVEIEGFVETSNNIGIVELKEEGMLVVSNQRSTFISRMEEMAYRVESIGLLAGAKVEHTKIFPAWEPNMDSDLLKKCWQVYETQFGNPPTVNIIHAGLECGMISDRCGGLDSISLGPTVQNPHSPDERLYIPSVEKTWKFLRALLASC